MAVPYVTVTRVGNGMLIDWDVGPTDDLEVLSCRTSRGGSHSLESVRGLSESPAGNQNGKVFRTWWQSVVLVSLSLRKDALEQEGTCYLTLRRI